VTAGRHQHRVVIPPGPFPGVLTVAPVRGAVVGPELGYAGVGRSQVGSQQRHRHGAGHPVQFDDVRIGHVRAGTDRRGSDRLVCRVTVGLVGGLATRPRRADRSIAAAARPAFGLYRLRLSVHRPLPAGQPRRPARCPWAGCPLAAGGGWLPVSSRPAAAGRGRRRSRRGGPARRGPPRRRSTSAGRHDGATRSPGRPPGRSVPTRARPPSPTRWD